MRPGTRNPTVRIGATVLEAIAVMTKTPGRPGATSVVDGDVAVVSVEDSSMSGVFSGILLVVYMGGYIYYLDAKIKFSSEKLTTNAHIQHNPHLEPLIFSSFIFSCEGAEGGVTVLFFLASASFSWLL